MHFPKKPESNPAGQPIGVFDSGIGGLTVARALRELLPEEDIFYLGDTARLPYGGKDRTTIERYSLEIAGLLLAENAKMLIDAVIRAKPATAKGKYVKSAGISSTMGPGIKLDTSVF